MNNQENIVTCLPVRRRKLEENAVRTVLGEIGAGTRPNKANHVAPKQKHFDSRYTTFTAATFKPTHKYHINDQTIEIYYDTENKDMCSSSIDTDIGHTEEFDKSANSLSSEWDHMPTLMTPCWFDGLKTGNSSDKIPLTDFDYLTTLEYSQDIYLHLREKEKKHTLNWTYMSQQPDITHNMRSILIDWLIEVAGEYQLLPDTLHLTISCIDRFMSVMSVNRSKLQLVGITAMFVASKYEEVHSPDIHTFIYISDNSYTKNQILSMEKLLLSVVGFDLFLPTSYLFVNQFSNMFQLDQRCSFLASYINELALLDGETFLRFAPSILAAGSIALARHTLGDEIWSDEMAKMSGYSLEDFTPCLIKLYQAFKDADNHPQQSIQEKYRNDNFDQLAHLSRQVTHWWSDARSGLVGDGSCARV